MHFRPSTLQSSKQRMFRRRSSSNGEGETGGGGGRSGRRHVPPAAGAANGHRGGESGASARATEGEDVDSPALIQRLIIFHDGLMPPVPVSPPPAKSTQSARQRGLGRPYQQQRQRWQQQSQQSQQQPQQRACRRNPDLGEDASLEEHGEFILYYYDRSLHFADRGRRPHARQQEEEPDEPPPSVTEGGYNTVKSRRNGGPATPADHATEEAVRFAGVCRALRSLPRTLRREPAGSDAKQEGGIGASGHSLGSSDDADEMPIEEADVVRLSDSTLVYVDLELRGDVVAVAQVPRSAGGHRGGRRGNDSSGGNNISGGGPSSSSPLGYGADPTAVKSAIRRMHASFSLWNGGGVHERLLDTKRLEGSKDWVLEVIVDEKEEGEEEERDGERRLRRSGYSNLKTEDDSMWEVTGDGGGGAGPTAKVTEKKKKKEKKDVQKEDFAPAKLHRSRRNNRRSVFNPLSRSVSVGSTAGSSSVSLNDSLRRLNSSFSSYGSTTTLRNESIDSDLAATWHPRRLSTEGSGLSAHAPPVDDGYGPYAYGGMEELFRLRREHRKLSNELGLDSSGYGAESSTHSRWTSGSNPDDLFNDIANDFEQQDCARRIGNLLKLLPVTKLRRDLTIHFDRNLRRSQGVCEVMHGGVGRCVVELVPPPIVGASKETSAVRGQHPPLSPSSFVCLAAGELMETLMQGEARKLTGSRSRLVGMSMLHQHRVVLSRFFSTGGGAGRVQPEADFPPDIAYMIAEHFHSSQNEQTMRSQRARKDDSRADGMGYRKFVSSLSGGSAKNDDRLDHKKLQRSWSASSAGREKRRSSSGSINLQHGFMAPPAPFLSDNDDQVESIFVVGFNKHVWLPRVYLTLPSLVSGSIITGQDNEEETYAAYFDGGEISFILLFNLTSPKSDNCALAKMSEEIKRKSRKGERRSAKMISNSTLAFTDMLTFVSEQLTGFCDTYNSHDADELSDMAPVKEIDSDRVFPGEAGIDIIYIDREESSFVLLSQHDLSSNEFKRIAPENGNGSRPKFALFGMGKPKEENGHTIPHHALQYRSMLDCRHKLAAYLPLDVMLAFDDMFNEFANNAPPYGVDGGKSMELCTFLPQGWVYGRASGSVELYVLLDTSKFVTINDVQKAVTRVRERLFNNKIR